MEEQVQIHVIRHEQPVSVELSRNAKGVTEITVKVHGDDNAIQTASVMYDNLRMIYPYGVEETTEAK